MDLKLFNNKIWIASFDIGKCNFCFHIEEIDISKLTIIKNIKKNEDRYNIDGTPTKQMEKILQTIYMNGKTILNLNSDLTEGCIKSKYLDTETFHNLTDLLDKYSEYWIKTSMFVIEQQLSFRGKINTMALKLGQHTFSYFAFKFGRFKPIIEFPAYHKTHVLGAEKIKSQTKNGKIKYKNIDKPARKKWSINKALEILKQRGEDHLFTQLKTVRKKDDLADCLLQCIAFIYLAFIAKTI